MTKQDLKLYYELTKYGWLIVFLELLLVALCIVAYKLFNLWSLFIIVPSIPVLIYYSIKSFNIITTYKKKMKFHKSLMAHYDTLYRCHRHLDTSRLYAIRGDKCYSYTVDTICKKYNITLQD